MTAPKPQPMFPDLPAEKQTRGRRRVKFEFWLDANKDDQAELGDRLWSLKAARQFAPTLRNAVRLFFDLKDGGTAVLRELFPHLVERLERDAYERGVASQDSYEVQQLTHLLEQLQTQIATNTIPQPVPAFVPTAASVVVAAPVDDDLEPAPVEDHFDSGFDDFSF